MAVDPLAGMSGPTTPSPEANKSETSTTKAPMPSPAEAASMSMEDIGKPVGAKDAPKAPEASAPKEAKAAVKEEIKNLKKKYALTVDGKNEDLELDLGNDEEVKKYLQKAKAADKRFQEAAEVRKAAMEFIDQLRKNPRRVLADPNIGIDVRKFAEEILNEEIKEMEKTPEQREKDKLLKELEEFKAKAKENEENAKNAERQRLESEQERILETEISSALDVGGLPKTPRTVKAMAEMMMIALENGIDLSPKDIAPIVKNTNLKEFKEIVDSLSDDQLEDFLGKEVISRLRKKSVAKVKSAQTASAANSIKSTGQSPKQASQPAKNEKISYRKFFGV